MKPTLSNLRGVLIFIAVLLCARPVMGAQFISCFADGSSLPGASGEASISGDGRYVVFSTLAVLNGLDTNGRSDVYLKDRQTGALRRLSTELGGDQPMISANGRYVIFRALDSFPKIRFVDLESTEPPRTISIGFNGNSFRYADSATVSPDGHFVAYSFRPIPGFNNASNPFLCVSDTFNPDRLSSIDTAPQSYIFSSLGRGVMNRDGNQFFFDTTDSLLSADTNTEGDIYYGTPNNNFVVRLSATENGLPETGRAFHPVVTADGGTVFFISNRRLRFTDTDGRATIYRSTSADGYATPQPIPTSVVPVAMAPQSTSNGQFLVFLGSTGSGPLRPYIWRASDGAVREIAAGATVSSGAPVISGDNGSILFVSTDAYVGGDRNGTGDVYLVQNPFPGARLAPTVVTLGGVANGASITEGTSLNLSGSASGGGGALFTALEVDGVEIARSAGGAVSRSYALTAGVHTLRAVALSVASVPGQSASVEVKVLPPANSLRITGPRSLRRALQTDGTTAFKASVRIDNTFATASGPLQILVVEIPNAAKWEFFGNINGFAPDPERVLSLIDVPALPGGGGNVTALSDRAAQAVAVGDGQQGTGSTVVARLREFVAGAWVSRGSVDVLAIRPALNEDTAGPNGGVPVLSSNSGTPFTPTVFQSVQVQGSTSMVEQSSLGYSALAIYNNGNQPCRPDWSVVNGGSIASISPMGVLSVGDVSAPTTIGVRASFGGRVNTLFVTITPVSPIVSVVPVSSLARETGTQGSFKFLRTPVENTPLTITYRVSGNATAGQDYTALSGTVTIPAGSPSTRIQVVPLDDNVFEGRERVAVSILPSPKYRRSGSSVATVVIEDNEPGQPDATIQPTGGAEVGAFQFEFNFPGSAQRAFLRGIRDAASAFNLRFYNRSSAATNFTITGGSTYLGCKIQYFSGTTDVTAQVIAGSFVVNNVQPGGGASLRMRIIPTTATPIGTLIRCAIRLDSGAGNDTVEALVRRVQ